jgi:hypothetical protein
MACPLSFFTPSPAAGQPVGRIPSWSCGEPLLRTHGPFPAIDILRTTAAKRFKKVENATALIWKLLQVAESTFRRLKGAELLPAVYAGAQYVNGAPRIVKPQQGLAA